MEPQTRPNATASVISQRRWLIRSVIGILVLLTFAYIIALVLGRIPAQQKLGGADVGMVVMGALLVAVLLRPELLEELTHLKLGGVEFELRKLQEDQQIQRDELDDVRFVLTLLLQRSEQQHLRNLEKGATQNYEGNDQLRAELRKLRTLGLIQNYKDRTIGEITDKRKVDLKDIVGLTERGRHYLERLGEYKDDRDKEASVTHLQ